MKNIVLRISAWLSFIGGAVLAFNTFRVGAAMDLGGAFVLVGIAYFISGLAAWALFSTVADIAHRLEEGFIIQQ